MSHQMQVAGERHYPPHQIAALTRLLGAEGITADAVLAGTGLRAAELDDVACPTSLAQYLTACQNALGLSSNASLPFLLGRGLHLPDHGMYGLMLLSCGSVSDYFRLAEKYQGLTVCALSVEAQASDGGALWVVHDDGARELPDALRVFLVEQQFAQLVTQLHDLLGPACGPALACFAHPAPANRSAYSEHLQCPCVFGWHRNELRFDKALLSRRPRLANPFTAAALQSACDGQLAEMGASIDFAGMVHRALRLLPDPGAGMKAVAGALKMTDRTLRRRLAGEGTSFATIADQVRYSLATQHLRRPEASVEQIAAMTGFSDSANFRRAFLRWTGMTPTQFRRLQQERCAHAPARAQRALMPALSLGQ